MSWSQAIAALSTSGGSETAMVSANRSGNERPSIAVIGDALPAASSQAVGPHVESPQVVKPQVAMAQKINVVVAALRRLPRKADQISGPMIRKPSSARYGCQASSTPSIGGPKATKAMPAANRKMPVVSARFQRPSVRQSPNAHSTTTGTMIKLAAASASHQFVPVASHAAVLLKSTSPATISPPSATAAPISAVGTKTTTANFATPRGVSNVLLPYDQRSISQAPAKPASAVPAAAKPGEINERVAIALKENDPSKIAGHMRGPLSRNKANANPVGGHSGVPVGLSDGRISGVAASPT